MSNKNILITGATSGIGFAAAQLLAKQGHQIIACGRRQERLNKLIQNIDNQIYTLNFDVRDRSQVYDAIQKIPAAFRPIDVLVNNAGNAHGLAPVHEGSEEDWDAMLDINVKGALYVAKAIIKQDMIPQNHGHIIHVGSIAGKQAYANGNVYCASKFALDAIIQSMRLELLPHGIKVSGIHPGLVETEFSMVRFKGDKLRASKVYENIEPLQAEDIAQTIAFMINSPEHVNIADVVVFPKCQADAITVKRN